MKGKTTCLNLLGNIGVYLELKIKYLRLKILRFFFVPNSYRFSTSYFATTVALINFRALGKNSLSIYSK
jgi:hypothetical protein